jgi:hypothetical protein
MNKRIDIRLAASNAACANTFAELALLYAASAVTLAVFDKQMMLVLTLAEFA